MIVENSAALRRICYMYFFRIRVCYIMGFFRDEPSNKRPLEGSWFKGLVYRAGTCETR